MTDNIMFNTVKELIYRYVVDDNEKLEIGACRTFKHLLTVVIKYQYDELIKVINACYKSC